MIGLILIIIAVCFIALLLCPIRVFTAYQLTTTGAWREWECWKNKLEEQGFAISLKEVEQCGTATRFYYTIKNNKVKKNPQIEI